MAFHPNFELADCKRSFGAALVVKSYTKAFSMDSQLDCVQHLIVINMYFVGTNHIFNMLAGTELLVVIANSC